MTEQQDIYVVDTRNALTDNRTQGPFGIRPTIASRPVIAQPMQVYSQPAAPQQPQIVYAYPPQHPGAAHVFGKMNAGQLIDLVAQVYSALMPLPAKPASTSDAPTDVANMLLYQEALAQHAKRDEQVRTLGNIVTKLVG